MNLQFNLEYQTTFGEELVLNLMSGEQVEQHKMTTHDGLHWFCNLSMAAVAGTYVDYYYSLCRGDKEMRHEWLVVPHRLEFAAAKARSYIAYDHWLDIPEDSYMYSSAFTDCVFARKGKMSVCWKRRIYLPILKRHA